MDQLDLLRSYRCPDYEAFPSVPLYKDQVLVFLNQCLAPLWPEGETPLTSAMINNYVKLKVLSPPEHKKYSRDQVVCLYLILLFKQVLTMEEIRTLLALEFPAGQVAQGYRVFARLLEQELNQLEQPVLPEAAEHTLMTGVTRAFVCRRYASVLLSQHTLPE